MNAKLTLTIEETVIEKAKNYARKSHKSLSNLIENYLMALTKDDFIFEPKKTSTLDDLRGSFKMPTNFDYKRELTDRLIEKHL